MLNRRSLLAVGVGGILAAHRPSEGLAQMSQSTAYRFTFEGLERPPIKLADYAGKPILVVNTASFCGFVNQMDGLQALYAEYASRGLVVIGVPSGDFGGQEAANPADIAAVAVQHGVTFPMAAKSKVTGSDAHPFFKWAAVQRPRDLPRWNFYKFLVGVDGNLVDVWSSLTAPDSKDLRRAIEKELTAKS